MSQPPHKAPVLVIDDEPLLLRSFLRMLGHAYSVLAYDSGATALAYLEGGGPCIAILTGIRLGDMSGMTFYERVQQQRPDVANRVIVMTASATTPLFADFSRRHQPRVLFKPFGKEELLEVLDRMLKDVAS